MPPRYPHRSKPLCMDVNRAHDILCHPREQVTWATMKSYGWNAMNRMDTCNGCMLEKAKAKAVKKIAMNQSTTPGKRLSLDTTGPSAPSSKGSVYDAYIGDEASKHKWVAVLKSRSQVPAELDKLMNKIKGTRKQPKFFQWDNAGDHQKKLKLICDKHRLTMEMTAPHTPQQNGFIE